MIIPIPYRGISKGVSFSSTPTEFSSSMNNVRLRDVLEGRARIGQRPALVKWSTDQVGSATQPVVALCSVSSVE